jgi:hypothetical protein
LRLQWRSWARTKDAGLRCHSRKEIVTADLTVKGERHIGHHRLYD